VVAGGAPACAEPGAGAPCPGAWAVAGRLRARGGGRRGGALRDRRAETGGLLRPLPRGLRGRAPCFGASTAVAAAAVVAAVAPACGCPAGPVAWALWPGACGAAACGAAAGAGAAACPGAAGAGLAPGVGGFGCRKATSSWQIFAGPRAAGAEAGAGGATAGAGGAAARAERAVRPAAWSAPTAPREPGPWRRAGRR
jgi:hypothetical protein